MPPARTSNTSPELRALVARLETLEDEKRAVGEQIKEVMTEAKSSGYDAPTLRRVLRERRKQARDRQEQWDLFAMYWSAIGEDDAA